MTLRRMRAVLLAVTLAAMAGPASRAAAVESSETCGQCHETIFDTWARSAHARSLESPFIDVYLAMQEEGQRAESRVCLDCHAPLIDVIGDATLEKRVTWEGVNCEVCHALVSVDLSGAAPRRVLKPGPVKRGPVADAADTAHGVAYSELHTRALACAWCHEYANPEGTPILTTYSEWKDSSAAASDEPCQRCHMGRADAGAVDPRAERDPEAPINLHHVPGGHSLEQLHRALAFSIAPRREGDELVVEVGVRNKGAGHAVPTGMPGRRVILQVDVRTSEGQAFEERRSYGKSFVDARGERITRDSGYFAPGVRLESDTRIRPDEQRSEVFRFPVSAAATAYVDVRFHYEHSPFGTERDRTWLTFLSEKRTAVPESAP